MEYKINNTIKYNSLDGTLYSPEHNVDMLTLARISNELLLLFVGNAKVLLTRDAILFELWEKRGLSASSNNLNNHVSILRKALAQCGCTGVITTVPKQGFFFDAEIIAIKPSEERRPVVPADSTPGIDTVVATASVSIYEKRKSLPTQLIKFILFLLFAITLASSYFLYDYLRLNAIRSEVLRIKQCRFYLIDDLTRRMPQQWVTDRIQEIVGSEDIDCDLKANVYYSADKKLDSSGNSTLHDFFGYCPFDSKAPCENYIFTGTEEKREKDK
ncbi:winged helix-turn-helix domain-containing protein [Rahnella sp. EDr1-12]|jgi:DNA-binding winged helix-turn-helix (wHTH) protein|uniref:winged helix-turn-helix domain-containing protein n=1 Tax=unclassified Rahnella TaxID=2635087 RepID=UPI003BA902DF